MRTWRDFKESGSKQVICSDKASDCVRPFNQAKSVAPPLDASSSDERPLVKKAKFTITKEPMAMAGAQTAPEIKINLTEEFNRRWTKSTMSINSSLTLPYKWSCYADILHFGVFKCQRPQDHFHIVEEGPGAAPGIMNHMKSKFKAENCPFFRWCWKRYQDRSDVVLEVEDPDSMGFRRWCFYKRLQQDHETLEVSSDDDKPLLDDDVIPLSRLVS